MRLLLDTHGWLWLLDGSPRLSATTLELLADPTHQLSFSVASVWEVAAQLPRLHGNPSTGCSWPRRSGGGSPW